MSKTRRRKNAKVPKYVTHKHTRIGIRLKSYYRYYIWEWIPLSKDKLKKALAKYHSDSYTYDRYNDLRSREYYSRAKDNIEMQKLNAWKDYEDYLFTEKNRNFPDYY